jgi:hypothetical protein
MANDFVARARPWASRLVKVYKVARQFSPYLQELASPEKRRPRPRPKRGGCLSLFSRPVFFVFGVFGTLVAAVAGNWLGDRWRARYTGQPGHQLKVDYASSEGETLIAINPVLTNCLPAALLGLVLRPGWLWAFVSGALISALVGNRYEGAFMSLLAGLVSRTGRRTPPAD